MKIHIITIFPEAFESFMTTSIVKNAISKGFLEIALYKLNNFSYDNFKRVDDKVYGSHGQLIKPDILQRAIDYVFRQVGRKIKVIYMSPRGDLLTQEKLDFYAKNLEEEFIIICGHYEGIDQRIVDNYVDIEISIGNYVISSGELASQVFIDGLIRLKDNVIGNKASFEEESFSVKLNRQKEYPQYTTPREFMGISVPEILLSGNHKEIANWKQKNLKL